MPRGFNTERILFSTNSARTFSRKRMKMDLFVILHTKIDSKCIRVQSVRAKTIKLLEGNIGVILYGAELGKTS